MTETDLLVLLAALATSLFTCLSLLITQKWHGPLSLDHDLHGVQKIHLRPVPRIGGLGIAAGLAVGALLSHHGTSMQMLLLCALPVFGAGLLEDLTKKVSVRMRLLASFLSAALAIWLLNACLSRLDTPGLDELMLFVPLAVVFTCFAVGGVTNAINIIDGLNGLAAGSVIIMLGGLSAIASWQGDTLVLQLCLTGIAALAGFMLLNFPLGKIFMGDGGAYLAGFWLAECAVLLLVRNPEVSTWAVLLACLYPVWETSFSMFRRHVLTRVSSGAPDIKHFHHMILQQCRPLSQGISEAVWMNHGLASMTIWTLVLACQIVAVTNHTSSAMMIPAVLLFCLMYQLLYAVAAARVQRSAAASASLTVNL